MSTRGRKPAKKVEKVSSSSEDEVEKELEEQRVLEEIITKTPVKTPEKVETKFETNDPQEPEVAPVQKPKSIADFDSDEVEKLDVGAVKELDSVTLLKILIVRGKKVLNPTLWKGAQETLRRLNGEVSERPERPDFRNNRRDNGRNNRDNGGGRGRFQPRNQEFTPRNQAPQMQQTHEEDGGQMQERRDDGYRQQPHEFRGRFGGRRDDGSFGNKFR